MRPICFLSDFGLADDFVGTCKGVMVSIAPGIQILDLTHEIPGFKVEAGAEILQHATRYMPAEAVYLAIVDPGVGTKRRGVALRTSSEAFLVGPDNGLLLSAAEAMGGAVEAVALTNDNYHLQPVSNTFHGRDVFAPTAAHLAAGVEIGEVGEEIDPISLVDMQVPDAADGDRDAGFSAHIISIDRYGNARLSVLEDRAGFGYGSTVKVDAGDGDMAVKYVETFGSAKAGELILVPDSHWRLSLAINRGSAAQALSLKVGGRVRIQPPDGPEDAGA
ncbi:MAG: SAM-dependent chlorinase/fluorinase [Rubrobacter sp.]|nr:SAM-dependent chlorinase/fluorinase [Rubrobacter sp.]